MPSTTDEHDSELRAIARDLVMIAQQVKDDFRSLYEDVAASGDEAQIKEVQGYMNEEAQGQLKQYGEITGFEIDFEFDFEGEIDFDAGIDAELHFSDLDPPEGTSQG